MTTVELGHLQIGVSSTPTHPDKAAPIRHGLQPVTRTKCSSKMSRLLRWQAEHPGIIRAGRETRERCQQFGGAQAHCRHRRLVRRRNYRSA